MKRERASLALVGVAALMFAFGAQTARAGETRLDIPSQDLETALRQLASQANVELLFDARPMAGHRNRPVHGTISPETALRAMLSGSGFAVHRSSTGTLIISAIPSPQAPTRPPASSAQGENTAVSELLVVGSRSLNTAIRRSESDIQPYSIFTPDQIATAQAETIEDFLRTRDPHDAQVGSMAQAPVANGGAVRSRIDLGGLGAAQTLVLVDGRRLPSIPGQNVFEQGDLNGIPLAAIERIESLTSTAGGIFGPGATGGVINVVLKRDYDGGELDVRSGVSDRGDARHFRLDGRWGHAFFGDRTQVMLAISHAEDDGLTQGQRDLALRARQRLLEGAYLPTQLRDYGAIYDSAGALFTSAGLNVWASETPPGQGGSGGFYSYKPLDLSLSSGGLAALSNNAGRLDPSLSPDGSGTMQSLLSSQRSNAVLFNLRQTITPRIDALLDVLYAQTDGRATGPRAEPFTYALDPGVSGNPFPTAVTVTLPTPGLAATSVDKLRNLKATAGVIIRLGFGWKANVDLTYGRVVDTARLPVLASIAGDPTALDLFNPGADLQSLYSAYAPDATRRQVDTFADFNVRLSGRLATLPAGVATMTLLGEFRRERQPDVYFPAYNVYGQLASYYSTGAQTQSVSSAYAELRAPLLRPETVWPLRKLELQFAGRFDAERATAPLNSRRSTAKHVSDRISFSGQARTFTFTAGLRAFPTDGLMIRASVATGYLPPAPRQLLQATQYLEPDEVSETVDPKRGGGPASSNGMYVIFAGSPDQKPELARTFSAGFVAMPGWATGLRLSIDYTRIEKSHEISRFEYRDYQYFLNHEALFPDRVTRAPLTAADIAAGYTGGEVTEIDTTDLPIGRSVVQTVDLDTTYAWTSRLGAFRAYVRATWEPDFRRKDNPDNGFYQLAGRADGPLTLRGNAGLDWSHGQWRAGLNVQAYGSYKVTTAEKFDLADLQNTISLAAQGAPSVPPQAYADLSLAYSQPRGSPAFGGVDYRLGVRNIFDTRPPVLVSIAYTLDPTLYYSPYGDPRGRRFELSVTKRF